MIDHRGSVSFLAIIVSIIIIIPIAIIAAYILFYGIHSVKAVAQSLSSYVLQVSLAVKTGAALIVAPAAPSLTNTEFLGQFYGSTQCINFLDQLARVTVLSIPQNPQSLSGQYFLCSGTYNPSAITQNSVWDYLPSRPDNASFPYWFPDADALNAPDSQIASGVNGSTGTISYYTNPSNIAATLGQSCDSFFNATTSYGTGTPAAYITSLQCAPIASGNQSYFISVSNSECSAGGGTCASNPMAFLYGNPGEISYQTCSYHGGASITCSFSIG